MKPKESRRVYDGDLFDVVVEEWENATREIVEHPGAVAVVAVDKEGVVTLVRQPREVARRPLLELPAGKIDEGETPLEAAKRELVEETGLRSGRWDELISFYVTPGYSRERIHLFLAEELERGEDDQTETEQIELVRWPVREIGDRIDELEDAKTVAGLLLYLHRHA